MPWSITVATWNFCPMSVLTSYLHMALSPGHRAIHVLVHTSVSLLISGPLLGGLPPTFHHTWIQTLPCLSFVIPLLQPSDYQGICFVLYCIKWFGTRTGLGLGQSRFWSLHYSFASLCLNFPIWKWEIWDNLSLLYNSVIWIHVFLNHDVLYISTLSVAPNCTWYLGKPWEIFGEYIDEWMND